MIYEDFAIQRNARRKRFTASCGGKSRPWQFDVRKCSVIDAKIIPQNGYSLWRVRTIWPKTCKVGANKFEFESNYVLGKFSRGVSSFAEVILLGCRRAQFNRKYICSIYILQTNKRLNKAPMYFLNNWIYIMYKRVIQARGRGEVLNFRVRWVNRT